MKKTKLMMPILGIAAIGSAIAPLTALTSCNKAAGLKVELYNNTTLEKKVYANTKTINLYFKQNITTNVTKTRVKIVNLKINGAEVSSVAGLTKMAVDASGGIRVTLNIETMFKHFSNPSSIEFDLLFYNNTNNQSYTIEGFKITADQEVEVPHPFESDDKVIKGFVDNTTAEDFDMEDFADAYPDIFAPRHILADTKIMKTLSGGGLRPQPFGPKIDSAAELDVTETLYNMVIPKSFTKIDDAAFVDIDKNAVSATTIPSQIISLEFEAGSKMTEIGAGSFAASPFLFVTLPESIETLGEGGFIASPRLISMQFAPTSENKLTIPGGFLYAAPIIYLKLPSYVNKITTATPALGTTIPALGAGSLGDVLLDLTEWTTKDLEDNFTYIPGAIAISSNGLDIFASGDRGFEEVVFKKFIDTQAEPETIVDDCNQMYDCKPLTGDTAELIIDDTDYQYCSFVESLHAIPQYLLGIDFPLGKLEFPNYCVDGQGKTYKITGFEEDTEGLIYDVLYDMVSSVVLPNNLTTIGDNLFSSGDYLWQVYIPYSVTTIEPEAFAWTELSSIIYSGTMAQWKQIDFQVAKDGDKWHEACPEITVTCTDGTITIATTREDTQILDNQ